MNLLVAELTRFGLPLADEASHVTHPTISIAFLSDAATASGEEKE